MRNSGDQDFRKQFRRVLFSPLAQLKMIKKKTKGSAHDTTNSGATVA